MLANFCLCFLGVFPEPDHDPVIQIASVVVLQGKEQPFVKVVMTLGDCAPIVGSQVRENNAPKCFK